MVNIKLMQEKVVTMFLCLLHVNSDVGKSINHATVIQAVQSY